MKSVYLAGPMRGIPQFNVPTFMLAARLLRARGLVVLSPAEHDMEMGVDLNNPDLDAQGFDMRAAFLFDFGAIMSVDAVVFLPWWRASTGCRAERVVAFMCRVPCYELTLADSQTVEMREILATEAVPVVSLRDDGGPG